MIVSKQFIGLLPLLILMLNSIFLFIFISFKKDLNLIKNLSIIGFLLSFISLFLIKNNIPINIGTILSINFFSILYFSIFLLVGLCSSIFFSDHKKKCVKNPENFYLLINLSIIGSMFAIISNHMISMFVGMELMSLPMLALSGYFINEKTSIESALKYLVLSTLSSCFLLFGMALIYCFSGHLNFFYFNELSIFNFYHNNKVILFSWCFILTGFGIKTAIFPFHLWSPNIYKGISFPSLLFFSTISKIVLFIILINFSMFFPKKFFYDLFLIIQIFSFFSIVLGSIMALFEKNIRKLIAYSSIAYFGSLLITIITVFNSKYALIAFGINIINYIFSNIVFLGALNIISAIDKNHYHNNNFFYKGLFWRNPILAMLITVSIFSFSGIPFTIGFFGKFYLFLLIIQQKLWLIGLSLLLGSTLGMFYYLRILVNIFSKKNIFNETFLLSKSSISNTWMFTFSGILILTLTIMILFFGIYPNFLINILSI
ncbi:NADH-quinone oxidoreductase subunit N [Buchnera aphidicola]|uniref:NADH-quinone oxidoreductase subunit N n=1 Tax=Buchnera aphidicola TaxID=9 RepID=UPI003464CD8D